MQRVLWNIIEYPENAISACLSLRHYDLFFVYLFFVLFFLLSLLLLSVCGAGVVPCITFYCILYVVYFIVPYEVHCDTVAFL